LEAIRPVRVETRKNVKGKPVKAGFGRNILDCFNHIRESRGEGCSFRFRIRDEIERPSSFGSVGRSLVFCNEMTKVSAVE